MVYVGGKGVEGNKHGVAPCKAFIAIISYAEIDGRIKRVFIFKVTVCLAESKSPEYKGAELVSVYIAVRVKAVGAPSADIS